MFGFRRFHLVAGLLLGVFAHSVGARADTPPTAGDPPEAVGRIAVISGTVLFRADPSGAPMPAEVNYPLSLANVVETAPDAQATIDIAAGRVYLDGGSRLKIGALADGSSVVALDQGALLLRVLPGGNGQVFTVETPQGSLRIDQPGYYEVKIGADAGPVIASALEGGAQFRTPADGELILHPGERISVGVDAAAPERGAVAEDDLIRRVADEIQATGENDAIAPEHVSPQVTGFQDLARYGIWELTESYGPVWEPQVGADWEPYSRGRWTDIAPWGKTWIDEAPWGFAPFHYGRWIKLNERWAWLPGETGSPPVYAPALVSFFETPKDKAEARRWIPLGPEEPYLPPYPVSIVYFRAVNAPALPTVVKITKVVNIVQITNVVKIVDRRPVLILGRLANRPGAPKPKPRPKPSGAAVSAWAPAIVVTQPGPLPPQFQTGPSLRAITPEIRIQTGPAVIASPSPTYTAIAPQPAPVVVLPQPQQPIVVIRNVPPANDIGSGGGATQSAPMVVQRTMPAGATNPTLGTAPMQPTVTFGASPGPNGVTFGGQ
jgi:hypothetical protein